MVTTGCDVLDGAANVVTSCHGCGSRQWTDFFELRDIPVDVGAVLPTKAQAVIATRGQIKLAYCHGCGLVWNRSFQQSLIAFQPGYEAGLHHSPAIRAYTEELTDRLIERFNLHSKAILEIGCGSGYLLRRLCEKGGNHGTGLDPAVPHTGPAAVSAGRLEFLRELYSPVLLERAWDLILCQSVLEDIPAAAQFLASLRSQAGLNAPSVYFEVFNAERAFERQETWSIHYEQCNYFTSACLRTLFERAGFRVLTVDRCPNNEQYLFVEAVPVDGNTVETEDCDIDVPQLPSVLRDFAAGHDQKVADWRRKLAEIRRRRQKAVTWGSGGKGISLLSAFGPESGIEYVVDVNPYRQRRFIPCTAQEIVPPEFLREFRPDIVIITNAAYEREIRHQLAEIGCEPEIWLS